MGQYGLSFLDYSKETATQLLNTGPVNVGSIVALEAQLATFLAATQALTLCTVAAERLTAYDNFISRIPPTNPLAQRENKWLITYADNSDHKLGKSELPGADLSKLVVGTDYADLTDTAVAAYVTSFNAFVQSTRAHAVTIISLKFVGRNT